MEAKGSNFGNWEKNIKQKEIKFCQDLSSRTLQRRAENIPQLIKERKKGNIAFLVLDRLVVQERDKHKAGPNGNGDS